MKNFTFLLKMRVLIILSILLSTNVISQTCESTVISFPYNEGFETNIGGWIQGANGSADDIDWTIDDAGTPSANTGPDSGNSSTWYIYTEASTVNTTPPGSPDMVANLESPCFDLTGISNPFFTFDYHMYGGNMGTLNIDISTNNGTSYTTTPVWTISGNQGNLWNSGSVDLS